MIISLIVVIVFMFQLTRRVYKGIPDKLRGDVWYRFLDISRLKAEQEGIYQVTNYIIA